MKSTLSKLLDWHRQGMSCRLAIVVETWGSAPRPVGSMLAIATQDGDSPAHSDGSVSSGCVEGDVLAAALSMADEDAPSLLEFGITQETAWAASLTCGGTIRILVLPITDQHIACLNDLATASTTRQASALRVELDTGMMALEQSAYSQPCSYITQATDSSAGSITVHFPPLPRLILSGMGHLSEQVAKAAAMCDFDVWIIDPRPAFTDGKRLDSGQIIEGWPDEVLAHEQIDPLTAILALSHDPKIDDPLLGVGLHSSSFYVGALGSQKSHANRLARMQGLGFTPDQCARIHGPVGMAIKAKGAGEIAMAIVADIIQHFRAMDDMPI